MVKTFYFVCGESRHSGDYLSILTKKEYTSLLKDEEDFSLLFYAKLKEETFYLISIPMEEISPLFGKKASYEELNIKIKEVTPTIKKVYSLIKGDKEDLNSLSLKIERKIFPPHEEESDYFIPQNEEEEERWRSFIKSKHNEDVKYSTKIASPHISEECANYNNFLFHSSLLPPKGFTLGGRSLASTLLPIHKDSEIVEYF